MARQSDIRIRRSAVAGAVPGSADLNLGELALNTADGAVYVKNGAGNIVTTSHDGILHYDEPNSRIGIGTVNPGRTLDLVGNARFISSTATIEIGVSTYVPINITNTGGYAHARINGFEVGGNTTSTTEGYIKTQDNSRKLQLDSNGWRFVSSTELMRLTPTGDLGIGTTTPAAKLDIKIASQGTTATVVAAGTSAGIYLEDDSSPTDNYFVSKIHTPGNNTAIGGIKFAVSPDGSNYSWTGIKGLTSTSGNAGNLAFYTSATNTSGDSSTERMRIDSAGRVGIGTSSPSANLHVSSSGDTIARITSADGNGAFLDLGDASDPDGGRIVYDSGSNLTFSTASTERMRIDSSGRLNIGNATNFSTADGDDLQVGNTSGSHGITIIGQNTSSANLFFGDNNNNDAGAIRYNHPNNRMEFHTARTQRMSISSTGAVTFNQAFTFPTAIGIAGQILKVPTTGTDLIWGSDAGSGSATLLTDSDGDTLVQVEESADEDRIRFDVAGSQIAQITNVGMDIVGDITVTSGFVQLTNNEALLLKGTDDGNTTTASRLYRAGGNATRFEYFNNAFVFDSKNDDAFGIRNSADTSLFTVNPNSTAAQSTTIVNNGSFAITNGSLSIGGSVLSDNNRNISIVNATSTGVVKHADGAASAPSITFTDDLDKGIYSTSDGVNIATGGARRAYFNSAGITSGSNVYTSSTGEFRNYGGVWEATAGLTGNGFNFINSVDGTAATISSTGNAVFSGTLSSGNITTTGYLRGPSTFTIDPAGHGDNTGTVVIAGNLQVDGTTTSINSTTLDVDDINITVAKGAANAAAANGAGLTVDGSSATLLYASSGDKWEFNKNLNFSGDNKHIYFNSTNTFIGELSNSNKLELRGGGSTTLQTVFINSSGNLGIGANAPDAKLDIKGNFEGTYAIKFTNTMGTGKIGGFRSHGTNGEDLTIYQDGSRKQSWQAAYTTFYGTSDAEIMRIKNDGKVGIGTANPSALLHLKSTTASVGPSLIFENTNNAQSMNIDYWNNGGALQSRIAYDEGPAAWNFIPNVSTSASALYIAYNGNVGIGVTSLTNGDKLTVNGNIKLNGKLFNGSSNNSAGLDFASNYVNYHGYAGHRFYAQAAGIGSMAERMCITADGNVGIGTTSPGDKLTIEGSGAQVLSIYSTDTGSQSTAKTFINLYGENTSGDKRLQGQIASAPGHNASNAGELHFSTNNSSSALARRMTIREDGNVGIGETVPLGKLHVKAGDAGSITPNAAHNHVIIEGSGNTGINIFSPDTSYQYLAFGDDGAANKGYVRYQHSNDQMVLRAGSTDTVFINDGNVGIGTTSPSNKLEVNGIGCMISGLRLGSSASGEGIYRQIGPTANGVAITTGSFDSSGIKLFVAHQNDGGGVGIGTTAPKAKLQVEEYGIDTTTSSTAATTQVAIHTFPIAHFRSARFTVQITNSTDSTYHSTEILAIHDGTTANITEFGEVHTGSSVEATFDADVSSGNFRLLATPASADNMVFKVVCHSLTV